MLTGKSGNSDDFSEKVMWKTLWKLWKPCKYRVFEKGHSCNYVKKYRCYFDKGCQNYRLFDKNPGSLLRQRTGVFCFA